MSKRQKQKDLGDQSLKIQIVLSRKHAEMLNEPGGQAKVFQAILEEINQKNTFAVRLKPNSRKNWPGCEEQEEMEPAIGF